MIASIFFMTRSPQGVSSYRPTMPQDSSTDLVHQHYPILTYPNDNHCGTIHKGIGGSDCHQSGRFCHKLALARGWESVSHCIADTRFFGFCPQRESRLCHNAALLVLSHNVLPCRMEQKVRVSQHTHLWTVESFDLSRLADADWRDQVANFEPYVRHHEAKHNEHSSVDHLHKELREVA